MDSKPAKLLKRDNEFLFLPRLSVYIPMAEINDSYIYSSNPKTEAPHCLETRKLSWCMVMQLLLLHNNSLNFICLLFTLFSVKMFMFQLTLQ
jgi:hypothetical protein